MSLDLCTELFKQKLTMFRIVLGILNQCRIALDLAIEAVEFVDGEWRRTLVRQFEHGNAFVRHVAGDPYRVAS